MMNACVQLPTEISKGDVKAVTDLLWEIAYQFQIKTISFECLHKQFPRQQPMQTTTYHF